VSRPNAGHNPRTWVSEDAVLAEMERLNNLSMSLVSDFTMAAPERAAAEAAHKLARAKRILLARHNGVKSMAEAEVIAEADDDVAALYAARLNQDALLESIRETLRSVRVNQDALRTAAASARDGVTGPGWKGGHNV
jgi:hypothetical protein